MLSRGATWARRTRHRAIKEKRWNSGSSALRRGEGSSGATKAFPSGFSGYNGFMVGKSAESVTAVTEAWARSPTAALAEVTGALFDGRSAGFSVPRLTRPLSRTTGCERASSWERRAPCPERLVRAALCPRGHVDRLLGSGPRSGGQGECVPEEIGRRATNHRVKAAVGG